MFLLNLCLTPIEVSDQAVNGKEVFDNTLKRPFKDFFFFSCKQTKLWDFVPSTVTIKIA